MFPCIVDTAIRIMDIMEDIMEEEDIIDHLQTDHQELDHQEQDHQESDHQIDQTDHQQDDRQQDHHQVWDHDHHVGVVEEDADSFNALCCSKMNFIVVYKL